MEELVNQVAARTGLSHEQAQTAAEAVIEFVKGKLPAPIAGQLDGYLGGKGDVESSENGGTATEQTAGVIANSLFSGTKE